MRYTTLTAAMTAMERCNRELGHPPAAIYWIDPEQGEGYWTVIRAWEHRSDRRDALWRANPDADRNQGPLMTPDRFREILAALHWTIRGIARLLGYDESTIRRTWPGAMPKSVAGWLEYIVEPIEREPLPEGWQVQKREPGRPPQGLHSSQ